MNDSKKSSETLREDSAATFFESGEGTLREAGSAGGYAPFGALETFREYRVIKNLPSSGAESDIYVIEREDVQRILKLYRSGIEPKIEVLRRLELLSREHPEELVRIFETGFDERRRRWYEIQDYAPFGTLKELWKITKEAARAGPTPSSMGCFVKFPIVSLSYTKMTSFTLI